jgi:hypothetical protein
MASTNFLEKECACSFVQNLGAFKDTFTGLIDAAITVLRTAQATIALWPADLGDQLKRIEYEAEVTAIEAVMAPLAAPFSLVSNYLRPYADCPPIATAAGTINKVRNTVLDPLTKQKEEIQMLIDALNLEGTKIEQLQNMIDQLNDLKDAIVYCDQQ